MGTGNVTALVTSLVSLRIILRRNHLSLVNPTDPHKFKQHVINKSRFQTRTPAWRDFLDDEDEFENVIELEGWGAYGLSIESMPGLIDSVVVEQCAGIK